VAEGTLHVYRLFDVGDALDLARAEALLAAPSSRLQLEGAQSTTALEIPRPPLHVALGSRTVPLAGGTRSAEASAHLFDYGVVSILYRFPITPGTDLADLVPLAEELSAQATPALDAAARAEAEELSRLLSPALERPHRWDGLETYQLFFVRRLEEPASAAEVLALAPIAELLLGETSAVPLSREERADVLGQAHSYLSDDLAVVDWNCAFLLEPSGVNDIPDLLEFATAHLLELRYHDAFLDRELRAIYDEIDAARGPPSVFTRRYGRVQRRTAALLVELSEVIERLENAVKIVGDFYLARLYQSSLRRFRLPAWQESVLRKQRLLAGVNDLMKSAADRRRGELLELTVVLLILWEILYALLRHGE
ncbi:MAG TPA: hypothetical protein VEM76_16920, partial [Anaeromyxobacteraceae bacterium]|nr:hypothetical protein [Anaeromyxobacteraceae bacterium]